MNTLLARITNESPSFFKKIQALGITLGVVGAALMSIPEVAPSIVLPAFVNTMAGYFIVAGTVAAAIAKTTVADSTVLEKK